MLRSIVQYRRFIWQQALADLRNRYAGTSLGVAWNVVHPLAIMAVYCIVFSRIMPVKLASQPSWASYALYLCCGFFPWLAFTDCVNRGCVAFVANASYLKKLPIPEQVFVAQAAAATALNLAISFALLLAVAIAVGFHPMWHWLLLPAPLLLILALGFGFGLLLGTLNVFFRDLTETVAVVLQIAMWTAPIVYLPDNLPPLFKSLLRWHPFVPGLNGVRDLFLSGKTPDVANWLAMIAWPAGIILLAFVVFRLLRDDIRDLV